MNVTLRKAILLALALPQVAFFAVAESSTNDDTEVMDVYGTGYTRPLTIDKPGETLVTQETIEIEQPTNIAELFEDIPGVSLDGGARTGGERISIWAFLIPVILGCMLMVPL